MLLILSPTYAFGVFYCPGWLLGLALLYSGLGTAAAHWVGKRLIVVNFSLQRYEADFRYQIVQVRDNAESIALYGAEACEERRLHGQFERIAETWVAFMTYQKQLGFFTAFYHHSSATFPYLVLAPNYFAGQITLGTMMMLFHALGAVKGGSDIIINTYGQLTGFRATSDRLLNFKAAVAAPKGKGPQDVVQRSLRPPAAAGADPKVQSVVASNITVCLPDGGNAKGKQRSLLRDTNLSVPQGQFVLLTAPEGSGKSCFFRALAGIWPNASGSVELPAGSLFVPQKSHIPQGSLKQAVSYPEDEDSFTDAEVFNALEAVGIAKGILEHRSLSSTANWGLVLSGGEAQRLAIAHAVLSKPRALFLDEATSAMGEAGALEVYALLRRPGVLPEGASVVSVSHEVSLLRPVHDVQYNLGGGCWIEK